MQCLVRVQKTREQGTALGCEGKLTARRKESKNNITAAVQDEIRRLEIEQIDNACAMPCVISTLRGRSAGKIIEFSS